MFQSNEQVIMIKGTSSGLIFYIDERAPFHRIYEYLEEIIQSTPVDDRGESVHVTIHQGHRYMTMEEQEQLRQLIEKDARFKVKEFQCQVVSKADVLDYIDQIDTKTFIQIVRSGQVLEVTGHLLLIGDVNPGGEVRATGNIYILGKLGGIAHAGYAGDEKKVIIASQMDPHQLRIAEHVSRSPDNDANSTYMECAYYHENAGQILIDSLHSVRHMIEYGERGMPDG